MESDLIDPRLEQERQRALMAQNADSIRFQIDVKEELEYLYYDLQGFSYDEAKQEYVRDIKNMQKINTLGANAIMTFLRPRITRIFSLSQHAGMEVDIICKTFAKDLLFMLCRHKEEFEIPSYQIMDNMVDLCDDLFRATLLKSLGGWEGDSIRKGHSTHEIKETSVQSIDKPKTSIFPFPFMK